MTLKLQKVTNLVRADQLISGRPPVQVIVGRSYVDRPQHVVSRLCFAIGLLFYLCIEVLESHHAGRTTIRREINLAICDKAGCILD